MPEIVIPTDEEALEDLERACRVFDEEANSAADAVDLAMSEASQLFEDSTDLEAAGKAFLELLNRYSEKARATKAQVDA